MNNRKLNKKCLKNERDAKDFALKEFKKNYGEKVLEHEPFVVQFVDDYWIVQGTSKNQKGGYPYIKIDS